MNRLTERDEYGNADIIALSDVMPELYAELSFSETNALTAALNRLAEYEETGLEPEICANYKQFEDEAIRKGVTFKRIVELMEAERAGRLVEKPQWISVKDRLPELPGEGWQSKIVIASCENYGKIVVAPMFYERAIVRKKQVYRWKYIWGRISDVEITHWMPLPEPPEEENDDK